MFVHSDQDTCWYSCLFCHFNCLCFCTLFSQSLDIGQQDFFLNQLGMQSTVEQRNLCEGALSVEGCKAALDGMVVNDCYNSG